MRSLVFLTVLMMTFLSKGYTQVATVDLPFLATYQDKIPFFQELITGGQYVAPSSLIKGDPYFLTRQFEVGSLRINGITYPEVPLIYDIYRDQLVTFHPIFNQKILIKPEKIDGFTLSKGQLFRYFSGNESFIHHGNGIYEVVGQGGTALALAKRYKTTKSLRELSRFDGEYVEKEAYYIWRDGQFLSIKNLSQAVVALGLSHKQLKKEVKDKGLQFKKSPEALLQFLVTYPQLK